MEDIKVTLMRTEEGKLDILYGHIKEIKEHITKISQLINIILTEEDFDNLVEGTQNGKYEEVLEKIWNSKERSLIIKRY